MTETVTVCDATHDNISHLPPGQAAGYSTGTGPHIRWTAADWAARPGAVRIDQDPAASDPTADVLDVEEGAAPLGRCAPWAEAAAASFARGTRPGQRSPAIYMSASMVTPVVNALIAGGITEGVSLWIADWDLTEAQARAVVQAAGGPFPVIGVQYRNAGLYDVSVFSKAWLAAVSGDPAAPHPAQWHGEYVTAGMFSLAGLAAKLGVPASTLLRMTAVHYGRFDDGLAAWLNDVAAGRKLATHPLPEGIRLWVD
jgi:hypothetical protein